MWHSGHHGNLWYVQMFFPKTGPPRVPPEDSGILQKSDSNFFLFLLPLKHTYISFRKNHNEKCSYVEFYHGGDHQWWVTCIGRCNSFYGNLIPKLRLLSA